MNYTKLPADFVPRPLGDVLANIRVPRLGPGRPRTRPDAVVADKAYAAGAMRRGLRSRGIRTVIPQKSDQIAARKKRGSRGGRPPGLDTEVYKGCNVVERSFALTKQWRGLATRYDKLAISYRAATILSACLIWSRHIGNTPGRIRYGGAHHAPCACLSTVRGKRTTSARRQLEVDHELRLPTTRACDLHVDQSVHDSERHGNEPPIGRADAADYQRSQHDALAC